MKRSALVAALLAVAASPAVAQSELDRLETAGEAAARNMESFLVSRVPELADVMVDWEWDDDMREVASCALERIRAEAGDQAVTAYIDAMDAFSTLEITSLEQMTAETPLPFNDAVAMQVATECRGMEVSMRRMQDSGMLGAMMDPAIMERLTAD